MEEEYNGHTKMWSYLHYYKDDDGFYHVTTSMIIKKSEDGVHWSKVETDVQYVDKSLIDALTYCNEHMFKFVDNVKSDSSVWEEEVLM